ncbi:MAG: DUF177 domain-containing protein [Fimbriimonadaceae bacterium]|nr:DUF177 domain-containing protein [Fimbriimonadaceae bacterium]
MKREDFLDLNEILQHPGKKAIFSVETSLNQEADLDLVTPVTGEIHAISTGNILLLAADLKTRCVVECSRCNEPMEVDIVIDMEDDFDVEGIPASYGTGGYARVVPEEEPEPIFQENHLLRDAYIRQGVIVSLPVQPLCTGDWDIPCPNMPRTSSEPLEEGHPAFQSLKSVRNSEDDAS